MKGRRFLKGVLALMLIASVIGRCRGKRPDHLGEGLRSKFEARRRRAHQPQSA